MRLRRLRSDFRGEEKIQIDVVCDVCFCYLIDVSFLKNLYCSCDLTILTVSINDLCH